MPKYCSSNFLNVRIFCSLFYVIVNLIFLGFSQETKLKLTEPLALGNVSFGNICRLLQWNWTTVDYIKMDCKLWRHPFALEPIWSSDLLLIVGAILSIWSQDLPNTKCGVLPFTLWKHALLPQNEANASLLGTQCGPPFPIMQLNSWWHQGCILSNFAKFTKDIIQLCWVVLVVTSCDLMSKIENHCWCIGYNIVMIHRICFSLKFLMLFLPLKGFFFQTHVPTDHHSDQP